jgi:hypothetical protein
VPVQKKVIVYYYFEGKIQIGTGNSKPAASILVIEVIKVENSAGYENEFKMQIC